MKTGCSRCDVQLGTNSIVMWQDRLMLDVHMMMNTILVNCPQPKVSTIQENIFSRLSTLSSIFELSGMFGTASEFSIWFDMDSVFMQGSIFSKSLESSIGCCCCSLCHWMLKRVTRGLSAKMLRVIYTQKTKTMD